MLGAVFTRTKKMQVAILRLLNLQQKPGKPRWEWEAERKKQLNASLTDAIGNRLCRSKSQKLMASAKMARLR